jgi:hypothetical protein
MKQPSASPGADDCKQLQLGVKRHELENISASVLILKSSYSANYCGQRT